MPTKARDKKNQEKTLRAAHEIWLAGLGALSTVEEEDSRLFQQLVARGRSIESRDQKREKPTSVKSRMAAVEAEFKADIAAEVKVAMRRFGVPTRADVQTLTRQVLHLKDRIDQLQSNTDSAVADPVGQIKSVIAATSGLRSKSGRLSAKKIAAVCGLPLSELASLLGVKRQTLWKTDDTIAIQGKLQPFERVARLRAVLPESDFRSWLNMPNEQLDGASPLELIRGGRVEVVAELAEDMLTGSPG